MRLRKSFCAYYSSDKESYKWDKKDNEYKSNCNRISSDEEKRRELRNNERRKAEIAGRNLSEYSKERHKRRKPIGRPSGRRKRSRSRTIVRDIPHEKYYCTVMIHPLPEAYTTKELCNLARPYGRYDSIVLFKYNTVLYGRVEYEDSEAARQFCRDNHGIRLSREYHCIDVQIIGHLLDSFEK